MRLFMLLWIVTSNLLAQQSYFTLDNVHSLTLYFSNESSSLTPDQGKQIKTTINTRLKEAGFALEETDAPILVIKIEDIEVEESVAMNVQLKLGEEVITQRKGRVHTFAYTYVEHKLFEGYDPYADTSEAVMGLLNDFIAAHQDDNEE